MFNLDLKKERKILTEEITHLESRIARYKKTVSELIKEISENKSREYLIEQNKVFQEELRISNQELEMYKEFVKGR